MSEQASQPLIEPAEHENPFLNREQINYAREQVAERHGLLDTPLRVVWPFLETAFGCCLPRRKMGFKLGLKTGLRNRLGIKVPKSDLRVDKDPYLLLGYGMNSYFTVMLQLMWLCVLICVVAIPLMGIYATGEQFTGLNAYSLGNLGGSDVVCAQAPIMYPTSTIAIQCPAQTFIDLDAASFEDDTQIYSSGLINAGVGAQNVCSTAAFVEGQSCNAYFKQELFESYLRTTCQGERNCAIHDLLSYFEDLSGSPQGCNAPLTQMFVQVACVIPQDQLFGRESKGLALACLSVFVSLFVINYLDYVKKLQENNYIEWDIKTVTAGDYSIEFDIKPSFFEKYCQQEHEDWCAKVRERTGVEYMTPQEAFKDWIAYTMGERLSQMPDLGLEEEKVEVIKIAKATMAFKNAEVIGLLRARGTAIKGEQWDKQVKIEEQINDLKNEKLTELTTPVSVFLTFENEEGISRALKYDEAVEADPALADLKFWLGDETIEIQPASEPSDIIWENRAFTPGQRRFKAFIVFIIIAILLIGSGIIIFWLSDYSTKMINKYPITDCGPLSDMPADQFQQSAYLEWTLNDELAKEDQAVSYAGYVQCFCDDQAASGADKTQEYKFDDASGQPEQQICLDYITSKFTTFVISYTVMIVIIVINIILKMITIELITWIGYDTYSELMTQITNAVFYSLFFNTGILLILVNANLDEIGGLLGLNNVIQGSYPDYTSDWYAIVGGTLVSTMLLNAFMPPLYEFQAVATAWIFQALDQGFARGPDKIYNTKQRQIYSYLELYTGPDYIVHYKYSTILNIIYVTMLYGVGLPVLFPIAIISFFIFWATERWQVAYCYQMPPAMDDKLTKNAMTLLSYTPILFLLNGFWMIGNKQIFQGYVDQIAFTTSVMLTGHNWNSIMDVNQATPMLLIGIALVFITIMRVYFYDLLTQWGFTLTANTIEVDENLPNFFEAVKLRDADWIVKEAKYYQETYGIRFVRREVVERLDDWKLAKKPISGIAWYNLLANQKYEREFNYFPTDMDGRNDFIVDNDDQEGNDCEQSDMVAILVNLAYVKQEVAANFRFGPGYSETFKQAMKSAE